MKEYIVGAATFLILMFFPLQWVVNQVNHYKIQSVNNIVHSAAQRARIDGYFKEDNINQMRAKLADALSINEAEVSVIVTTTPKYRFDQFHTNEMIQYEIGIPIDKILAMHQFFGIDDLDNQFEYIINGKIASELLAP